MLTICGSGKQIRLTRKILNYTLGEPLEWREFELKQFEDDDIQMDVSHCGMYLSLRFFFFAWCC